MWYRAMASASANALERAAGASIGEAVVTARHHTGEGPDARRGNRFRSTPAALGADAPIPGSSRGPPEHGEIGEVLRAPGRLFRRGEVLERDPVGRRRAVDGVDSPLPRRGEGGYAVDARQQVDAHGRDAEHDERARARQFGDGDVRRRRTQEVDQRRAGPRRVRRRPIDEDVDVLRRAWPHVEPDRVPADDQVPHAMGVQ